MQLLSPLRSKVPRIGKIGLPDHVIAIYKSFEEEFVEAVTFLNQAI
jgi:hypothetical protein